MRAFWRKAALLAALGIGGCGSAGDSGQAPSSVTPAGAPETTVGRSAPTDPDQPPPLAADDKYAPGVVLIRLKAESSSPIQAKGALTGFSSQAMTASGLSVTLERPLGVLGTAGKYRITSAASVRQVVRELSQLPEVESIQPDYVLTATLDPNDTDYAANELWGLRNVGQSILGVIGLAGADIRAPQAWDLNRGAGVVVAVIDSGVDYNHPDLTANMWTNPGEYGVNATNGVDDDNNGYVDDVHGINALTGSGDPMDDFGHGTHVAGILGAVGNNNQGTVGVAYQSQIMALKFLDASGHGFSSDAIECIDYAIAKGADLSNNSYGGPGFDQLLADAVQRAANDGQLFVASAGNDGADADALPNYPACLPNTNIISVGASTNQEQPAAFSNYGANSVDLFAPGQSIRSTAPGGNYLSASGTSMASPYVAGVVALVKSFQPGLTLASLKARVINGANVLGAYQGLCQSGGRLNAFNALTAQDGGPPISIDPFVSQVAVPGGSLDIYGQGFGAVQGSGFVHIGNQAANVTHWSASYIRATVPANVGAENTSVNVLVQSEAIVAATRPITVEGSRTLAMYPVTYNYRGLAGNLTNVTVVPIADEQMVQIPLGFTFNYLGLPYTNVTVSDNGFITFGDNRNSNSPVPLPHASAPNRMLAALWYDFDPGPLPGRLSYKLINNAPNRELIIDYVTRPRGFIPNWFPGTVAFQWVIKEGDNDITVHYRDTNAANTRGQLGWENGAGTAGVGDYFAASGTARRFVQQVPLGRPDSLTCENRLNFPNVNNVTGTSVDLSWDDKSSAEDGYRVYRRPALGGNFTLVATLINNTRSYTDNGLANQSSYVYQVKAYQGGTESPASNQIQVNTGTLSAPPPITGLVGNIAITGNALIQTNNTTQLTATGNVSGTSTNITNNVTWTTSNAAVANVSGTGLVRGNSAGNATITATSGNSTGSFNVTTVAPPPPPPS